MAFELDILRAILAFRCQYRNTPAFVCLTRLNVVDGMGNGGLRAARCTWPFPHLPHDPSPEAVDLPVRSRREIPR